MLGAGAAGSVRTQVVRGDAADVLSRAAEGAEVLWWAAGAGVGSRVPCSAPSAGMCRSMRAARS